MEDGLNLAIHENVFNASSEIFQRLENEIAYLPAEQSQVFIKNKAYPIARKIAAFGDPDVSYTFSGLTIKSEPWTPLLQEIKQGVEKFTGLDFNFVLVNRYENGNDCIGQHKDDESDLQKNYPICSLSFGETRTMIFKRPNHAAKKIELKSNTLLIMNPPTNQVWTHGIPKQKNRTGVRVSLTFRKIEADHSNDKRKRTDIQPEADANKKIKTGQHNSLVFLEDEIPEGMVHIGDSVFVYPSTFKGVVEVHIRRFTKYGKKFYPSKEGITINPHWIDLVMNRDNLPKTIEELTLLANITSQQLAFDSSDFENFTLTTLKTLQNGKRSWKSITLSSQQWTEMNKHRTFITEAALDNIYGSMDFLNAYKTYDERQIDEELPPSLDASLGTQYLTEILRDSLRDCIKDNGNLKDAHTMAEELWAHQVETINEVALTVDVNDIANRFYFRIWEHKDKLLLLKPAMYITVKFLKDVRLQDVLREVRNILCPPDTFEYYECLEESIL